MSRAGLFWKFPLGTVLVVAILVFSVLAGAAAMAFMLAASAADAVAKGLHASIEVVGQWAMERGDD